VFIPHLVLNQFPDGAAFAELEPSNVNGLIDAPLTSTVEDFIILFDKFIGILSI
jgi:hypothetical protein